MYLKQLCWNMPLIWCHKTFLQLSQNLWFSPIDGWRHLWTIHRHIVATCIKINTKYVLCLSAYLYNFVYVTNEQLFGSILQTTDGKHVLTPKWLREKREREKKRFLLLQWNYDSRFSNSGKKSWGFVNEKKKLQ